MIGWCLVGLATGALLVACIKGLTGAGYLIGFGTCLILLMGLDLLEKSD